MKFQFGRQWVLWACGISLWLLVPAWTTTLTAMPARAEGPTRVQPTPLPPPTPTPEQSPSPRKPVATLLLSVPVTTTQLFSVVQWQDINGGWNDVESWRGAVIGGKTIWWVEQKDWGTGPFQWVVYRHEASGDHVLGVSEPFSLPVHQGEIKRISVSIQQ